MPYLKKPSMKIKKFAKRYIENGGNGQQAVLDSYDVKSKENASSMAVALLDKPIVQETISALLDKAGISLDYLNEKTKEAIDLNLDGGKPQMSVASDLIKFSYGLHNVIPAKRSMNLNYSKKVIENKSYTELKDELQKMNKLTEKLLADTA